jgi:hypothetical protein
MSATARPHFLWKATVAVYASIGPELSQYDVDVDGAALVKRGMVTLLANVHYAWPHASGQYLDVASKQQRLGDGSGRLGSQPTEKSERKRTDTRSVGPFPRGTDGSNPVPSGSES